MMRRRRRVGQGVRLGELPSLRPAIVTFVTSIEHPVPSRPGYPWLLFPFGEVDRAGWSGIDRNRNSSNIGTVNAVSPCAGL